MFYTMKINLQTSNQLDNYTMNNMSDCIVSYFNGAVIADLFENPVSLSW